VAVGEEPTAPIERIEKEHNLWHDRFVRYYLAGPDRSLRSVYHAESGNTSSPPASWVAAAKDWRWKERAESYDAVQRSNLLDDYETVRKDARAKRRKTINALQELLEAVLGAVDGEISATKLKEIAATARTILEQSRAEFEPVNPAIVVNNAATVNSNSNTNEVHLDLTDDERRVLLESALELGLIVSPE
jgi:hypothetical protein